MASRKQNQVTNQGMFLGLRVQELEELLCTAATSCFLLSIVKRSIVIIRCPFLYFLLEM